MTQKPQPQSTMVRALVSDADRMDRIIPKLEKENRGSRFRRPGVITKALDALERELAKGQQAKAA